MARRTRQSPGGAPHDRAGRQTVPGRGAGGGASAPQSRLVSTYPVGEHLRGHAGRRVAPGSSRRPELGVLHSSYRGTNSKDAAFWRSSAGSKVDIEKGALGEHGPCGCA
ncbi:unnamed protein product [Prorocentrum cordatum]|uniref:Uncharacterized protein n=1 Tax=Prorocentrum cordatum TaxID=2364126 RepID=A0ABN9PY08_9DINO|nr:unnamed protein product [Polarella glacialis]